MTTILVIHTGGTIAMATDATGGVALAPDHPLTVATAAATTIVTQQLLNIPSEHMTAADWDCLEAYLRPIMAASPCPYDGIVITHGTDTLEETAYFLARTLPTPCPVILTGAMRAADAPDSDGAENYAAALQVASESQTPATVLVVLAGKIHQATAVNKYHTTALTAFTSGEAGVLGVVTGDQVTFCQEPAPMTAPVRWQPGKQWQIPILVAHNGMTTDELTVFCQKWVDGVVIAALGAGNLPLAAVAGVETLLAADIPVLITTRCTAGNLACDYDYPGSARHLAACGAQLVHTTTPAQARLALIMMLSQQEEQ